MLYVRKNILCGMFDFNTAFKIMIGGSDFARKHELNNLFYNINVSIESMCSI